MKYILMITLVLIVPFSISAQSEGGVSNNPGSIYLYSGTLSGSEQLKIKAYIWGQVRNPGLYVIPDDTDLLTLISSAGGPTENAKLTKIKIVRPTEEGESVLIVNLKEYTKTGNKELIPFLQPGDTVIVPGTTFYAFSKVAEWLADVVIIFSVYNLITGIK
ncbi:polysaccharide biosynthesis/export family protein [Candidatus Cloacimonadota bacterium]